MELYLGGRGPGSSSLPYWARGERWTSARRYKSLFAMRLFRFSSRVHWSDKFADLLIVVIGITIAFSLDSYKDKRLEQQEAGSYLTAFLAEAETNKERLQGPMATVKAQLEEADTLMQYILRDSISTKRMLGLSVSMTGRADFVPTSITLDNITYSGEFDLISDRLLRRQIIYTYDVFEYIETFEELSLGYFKKYIGPFLLDEVGQLQGQPGEIRKRMLAIIPPYRAQLEQQCKGYQTMDAELDKLIKALGQKQ